MFELEGQRVQQAAVGSATANPVDKVGRMSLTEALGPVPGKAPEPANDDVSDAGPAKPEPAQATTAAPAAPVAAAPPRSLPRLQIGRAKHGGEGALASGAATGPATGASAPEPKEAPNTSGITVQVAKKAAGNPSPSRTTVGVGEQVTFRAKGDGEWSAGSGVMGIGDSTTWTAPSTAGSVEISHTPTGGAPRKVTMNVLAPSGVQFKHVGDFPVAPAGVGMTANVVVLPTAVSFGNCEWLEVGGAPEGASGYFAELRHQGKGSLQHNPAKDWLPMGDQNNGIDDHAWTSDNPKLAKDGKGEPRYWAGGFGWSIPNKYRVKGEGEGTVFAGTHQQFTMGDDGSVTVVKGGASATAKGDFGEATGVLETYKSVPEAHAMLNRQGSRTKAIMAVMQYNLRPDRDQESVRNLVAALKEENIQLYVHVACTKTFNWFSRDAVTMTATGPRGSKAWSFVLDDEKTNANCVALNDLFDFATMTPAAIKIGASVENGKHTFGATLAFPFAQLLSDEAGSAGHYKLSAHLQ